MSKNQPGGGVPLLNRYTRTIKIAIACDDSSINTSTNDLSGYVLEICVAFNTNLFSQR
ncbi:hypothetical protein HUN01_33745 [Nostoc edaphicum CCNP1411]|uniref:Uncharacterized protein n=1 Tax=Nostoc edaphicum CCNP1411 TaxID=1472755 RepID=A0A7D7LJE0_9NOSO|nr:hypothetical protein [Nostoc edaphicum]QMS92311.1 hypothetical protein HUN01_33745 [Nostoc edaphicum CCNP1411]